MNSDNQNQKYSQNKNWIELDERPYIKGPGQMIRKLSKEFPTYSDPDLLLVWLSKDDLAIGIEQIRLDDSIGEFAQSVEVSAPSEDCKKLVAVFRAETKSQCEGWTSKFNFEPWNLLDVLLVAANRWWSNLCKNQDCCPDEGRSIHTPIVETDALALRHENWLAWLNLLNSFSIQNGVVAIEKSQEEALRNSLDDLAIRDCILNHLTVTHEARDTWVRIFKKLLDSDNRYNNHVVNCLYAAVFFSTGDLEKADEFTKSSLLQNPDYSLALLMQHGLEIKMDSRKIVSAFAHFTSDELLANTPVRN